MKTRLGISYRAILENSCLAQVQGINLENIWLKMWGLSGSLAFLAGAVIPLWYSVSTVAGTQLITPVIAASLLGGLGNPKGAFLEYRPFVSIIILVLVLSFRPEGLLGLKSQHEKMLL